MFVNQCMWSLGKDDEELRRFLENHHVRKFQTIAEIAQARLNSVTYRDSPVVGMHMVPEWCDDGFSSMSWWKTPRIS